LADTCTWPLALVAAAAGFLAARGTSFLEAVLEPIGEALGTELLDRYRSWRGKNVAEVVTAADDMAKEAGYAPSVVPGRVLWPLLEGASIEEDDELKKLWATLLANAADPSNLRNVTPAFVSILKELPPGEAKMLELVYTMRAASGDLREGIIRVPNQPDGSTLEFPLPYGDFQVLSDNLHRLGLVDFKFGVTPERAPSPLPLPLQRPPTFSKLYEGLPLTPLGRQFMAAVTRPPKDRTPDERNSH
jgi:Abortive infection alpha